LTIVSRAVFSRLHEKFYAPADLEQEDTGATAAARFITEKYAIEIEREGDWTSPEITCVLDFVEQAFRTAEDLVSVTATCDIIARMAESVYLFFDHNLVVLRDFCFRVVPQLNAIVPADESGQVNDALALVRFRKADATQGQAQLIDELLEALGVGDTQNGRQEITGEQDLSLFALEPDWCREAISFTIKNVSNGMRIDASTSVPENTYSVIEAMVSSRMVFHGYNLNALIALLIRVGPALDAMSDSGGPSRRLTNLLNVLKANPKSRTPEQQEDIDGLCEVLGRRTSSWEEFITGDGLVEEEEDSDDFVLI
jgi:hypothetical protein